MFGKMIASLTLLALVLAPVAWAENPVVPTQGVKMDDPAVSPQQAAQQQAGVAQVQQGMAAQAAAMGAIVGAITGTQAAVAQDPPPNPFPQIEWPPEIIDLVTPIDGYEGDVNIPDPNNPVV